MRQVYLDHGATSFPKPPCVAEAVYDFINNKGVNINRGAYSLAYSTSRMVFEARERLCEFFGGQDSKNVIFTANVTQSLNILLQGYLKPGDHVITTVLDHNAVLRPLSQLNQVEVTWLNCNREGDICLEELKDAIKANTKLVVMSHVSNVCGTILPVQAAGKICKEHGIRFIVDAAQSAGALPVKMDDLQADAIAFTGHKGLFGPQGIGGFVITDEMANEVAPIISGGTGSVSDSLEMPDFLPDKFEAGTLNLPGISGLLAALTYIEEISIETIYKKEMLLVTQFLEAVKKINGIEVVGKKVASNRSAVVSIITPSFDHAELSTRLGMEYGIMTRCGLHCAPLAHKALGTYPKGTVRISFSHMNTDSDVDYVIDALDKILSNNWFDIN